MTRIKAISLLRHWVIVYSPWFTVCITATVTCDLAGTHGQICDFMYLYDGRLQEQTDMGVGVDAVRGGLLCQGPTRIVFYPPDIPTALDEAHSVLLTKTYRQRHTDVLDKQIHGQQSVYHLPVWLLTCRKWMQWWPPQRPSHPTQ